MIVYIYGLQDPETKEVRYIGKANNPIKACHLLAIDVMHKQLIRSGLLT